MFAAALHALGRHHPHTFVEIDLVPARAHHFADARRDKDRESQCLALMLSRLLSRVTNAGTSR
jgi:hypothetical protein